ncbi:hypothetical protein D3C74_59730 [compost metagenome]
MDNRNIKHVLGIITLEQYVQEGNLQQRVPKDMLITSQQAKAQADEVWRKGSLEVASFDYEGYTLNMTFRHDDSKYLFDSVDIWPEAGTNTTKMGHIDTLEGVKQYATHLE